MEEPANDYEQAEEHREVVEPLWTRPLLDGIADDIPLADEGTQLVAEVRAGVVAIDLVDRLEEDVRMIALDPVRAMLDAARERAGERGIDQIFFVPERVDAISYADDVFDASVCLNGFVTARQVSEGIDELARVTADGGPVAVVGALGDSFELFYDLLDEAFRAHDLEERLEKIDSLRESLISPARLVAAAHEADLEVEHVEGIEWTLTFERSSEFLHSPLVRETFFPHWTGIISSPNRDQVLRYVGDALDTYWRHRDIETDLRAGFMIARGVES
jgi:SAM-dependent methyltransferase